MLVKIHLSSQDLIAWKLTFFPISQKKPVVGIHKKCLGETKKTYVVGSH